MHDLTKQVAAGPIVVPSNSKIVLATAAEIPEVSSLDDWDITRDVAIAPDRAFLVGRYCHGGLPANSNGHLFRIEELPHAHRFIPNTPLDMLHDARRIVGTHVASKIVYPQAQAGAVTPYVDTQFVKVLAAVWSFLFPDDAKAIHAAYDNGTAFLSMSCLPESVQCPTCGLTAPWDGYTSPGYCEHMQGTRPKWFNNPLFLGGAVIIPPVNPGWKDASITKLAPYMQAHPDVTETTFDQVAAMVTAGSQLDLEVITAQLVALAHSEDPVVAERASIAVAPRWDQRDSYPNIGFTPPQHVSLAAEQTVVEAEWLDGVAAGSARTRAGIKRIVDELTASTVFDEPAQAILVWAVSVWKQVVDADMAAMAPDLSTEQRRGWARDGVSMADGAFLIPDIAAVSQAITAFPSATDKAAAKRHIVMRAANLHVPSEVLRTVGDLGAGQADAAEQPSGAIVAVVPPDAIRAQLGAVDGIPAEEIHATLVFLGRVAEDGTARVGETSRPVTRDEVAGVVAAVAASQRPITATINGRGVFHVSPDEDATYASIDAPGLSELHARLVDAFEQAGIEWSVLHGFTPHITVAYTPTDAGPVDVPSGMSWQIDAIETWWGGEHQSFQFGTS